MSKNYSVIGGIKMAVFGEGFNWSDNYDDGAQGVFAPFEDDTDYDNLDDYFYKNFDPYDEGEKEREDEAGAFESISKQSDNLKEREEEKRAFESIPKHGVHAHAFKKGLDNLKMKELRKKNYTYREIAKQLGCSPNTVRNRLKKMEGE